MQSLGINHDECALRDCEVDRVSITRLAWLLKEEYAAADLLHGGGHRQPDRARPGRERCY